MSQNERDIFMKAIEIQKDLVYSLFGLEPKDQARIKSLIEKIKREKY